MRYNVPMRVISLQSGSNGNCIYVEAGGVKLLFDAGISGIQAKERLALFGRDVEAVDAVLISQDNNTPTLALATHRNILGDRLPLFVATRYEASGVMEI